MGLGGAICTVCSWWHAYAGKSLYYGNHRWKRKRTSWWRMGELVITTIGMEAQPLIRYRTGDCTRIIPGRCICGSEVKRLDFVKRISQPGTIREMDDVLFPDSGTGRLQCQDHRRQKRNYSTSHIRQREWNHSGMFWQTEIPYLWIAEKQNGKIQPYILQNAWYSIIPDNMDHHNRNYLYAPSSYLPRKNTGLSIRTVRYF